MRVCVITSLYKTANISKAMPNRTSVKRPRARRFKSPQSNKNTNFVGEMFVNNFDVPGFRKKLYLS